MRTHTMNDLHLLWQESKVQLMGSLGSAYFLTVSLCGGGGEDNSLGKFIVAEVGMWEVRWEERSIGTEN